jgi:steroid delta-isomerase-like uncharacterized protein
MIMRISILFVLTTVALFQCSENKENPLEQIARARVETMNRHDLRALGQLFSDSAKIMSIGFPEIKTGPAGAREVYGRYFNTSPDMKYEITSIVTGENAAVVEYTSVGTMNSPEAGEPDYMRGKKYTLKNCTRMNIENGKIVKEMTYFDQLAFLRQVGFFEHLGK